MVPPDTPQQQSSLNYSSTGHIESINDNEADDRAGWWIANGAVAGEIKLLS
jgi:hypothetical protein